MHHGWYEDQGLPVMPDNGWHHLVVAFDGYMKRIYLDGQPVEQKNIFLRVEPCRQLTLGAKWDGEFPFAGMLHSLKLYDTSLSANEIMNNYLTEK